jgi:site-specific DNA recombinase
MTWWNNVWPMSANHGPNGPTRAVVYLRISLDREMDGLAIDRQREDCEAIAADRGWQVVDTYVDQSRSAYDRNVKRPGYDQMVADYEAGRFDAIVCWDLDRFTRQPRQLEDWIEAAEERGLELVTANGEADLATDSGRLFARIKVSVNRAEMERKAARQRRAGKQRAEHGKSPKGVRPWGYDFDGSVIPDEAKVVQDMFTAFLRGESLRGIVARLNAEGVPTRRGRPWVPSSVVGILRNPRYAGLRRYNGVTLEVRGQWEPIVSEDVWRAAQSILDDPRRKHGKGTDRKYLGSSLYLCDACDRPMWSWSGYRYRCPDCHVNRSGRQIDQAVEVAVCERLADPRIVQQMAPLRTAEAQQLTDKATQLRDRLDMIGRDYDDGVIDGHRYRSARDRVQAELDDVERRRADLMGRSVLATLLRNTDPVAAFMGESLMVRRAVVDALVEVRLRPGRHGSRTFDPSTVSITPKG